MALLLAGLASYTVYMRLQKPKPSKEPHPPVAKVEEQKKQEKPPDRFSQRIEPGFRAVPLQIESAAGSLEKIAPGDRVDVLAVTSSPETKEGHLSRLLFEGVEVMDVHIGAETGGRAGRKQTVTLKMTPQQATSLSAADPAASLRLMLRNHQDQLPVNQQPSAFSSEDGIHAYLPQSLELETLIAPGMRAITLEVTATDGVGGFFRPGDRVDVVVTCPWGNLNLQSENEPGGTATIKETHRSSKIYFENLKIVSTDRSLHWNSEQNQSVGRVTLEVTPKQAEELTVLADSKQDKNMLRLISRNKNDDQLAGTQGVELLDLLGGRVPHSKVRIYRGPLVKDQVFYRSL
ncbi:Flp pilus assembly protein CpaB [Desulfobulbus elongatus]|uniref:Flp pilus assembly protein CpaB n=1 Tax=Desulfobulbus elongatus TaxID=53332 RepID=UPI00146FB6DF|nr:Flp pilus assembly protein CpaB [Desulfobulbus elongatus]